jgi:hypothetical protein
MEEKKVIYGPTEKENRNQIILDLCPSESSQNLGLIGLLVSVKSTFDQ